MNCYKCATPQPDHSFRINTPMPGPTSDFATTRFRLTASIALALTFAGSCKSPDAPDALPTISIHAGDGQSATAGSAVATAPAVKIVGANSTGVAGIVVTFAVASGSGSVTGATVTTNDAGIATVGGWTLGSVAGVNTLTANASGVTGSPATFTATAIAVPVYTLAVTSGALQTASVDANVTSPSVIVRDASNNPVAGVTVAFAVTSGGGGITGPSQVTNANGIATVGSWTLGPTPTENILQVTTQYAPPLNISAAATWVRRLSTGLATGCAMTAGGPVKCWGENGNLFREYGVSPLTEPASATPVTIGALPALASIGAGSAAHTCGIKSDASAVCWGRTGNGQLGDGNVTSPNPVATVASGISWADISSNRLTTCGVSTTGAAYCWGSNQSGEIGKASIPLGAQGSASPVAVDGGHVFTSITAGWRHACAITTGKAAYCWGFNTDGELGLGSTGPDVLVPTLVSGGHQWERLTAGARHTCGITTDKRAWCWGLNESGQLGDGGTLAHSAPAEVVVPGVKFTVIATSAGVSGVAQLGKAHTCALSEAGKPYCWGLNDRGQLGDGSLTDRTTPVAVGGNLTLSGLSLGERFSCGMRGDAIWCWGWNDFGQLGNGVRFNSHVPVAVSGSHTFTHVTTGGGFSCGIASSAAPGTSATLCWGGYDGTNLRIAPELVQGAPPLASIDAYGAVCARTSAGVGYCWGSNIVGMLGIGPSSITSAASPMAITGNHEFSELSVGSQYACGVTTGGAAYCWGNNFNGQLGSVLAGGATNTPTPTAVSGGLSFKSISAGLNHTCALTIPGAAYCWGLGTSGQLGNASNTNSTAPVAVAGGYTFANISVGTSSTCAVTTAGEGYCWGNGASSQLGNGSGSNRNTPGLISGGLTFSSVSVGGVSACGVTTGSAVYCWGSNTFLQVGQPPTTAQQAVPLIVSGGHSFTKVDVLSDSHTCAITTSGAALCWGNNFSGQLGNLTALGPPGRVSGF
jgi:alpha-tubulin suppressor-like RCC1 family protein